MSQKRQGSNPAVIVAIIGLIGTIVAALITAYFSYINTKIQIELPINTT